MAHHARWTMSQVTELFNKPFLELMFEAQQVHRQHFDPRHVQVSTLLSIKTGACPEDCKYCPQSARYKTGLESERLMEVEQVLDSARKAKNAGSTRFCMGAAWKNPHDRDMPYLEQMVKGVKAMGLEACMTLGTLNEEQAQRLSAAGLDYYNHNLDTSPEFYGNIITTRTYQERLDTLKEELHYLETTREKEVAELIKEARSFGDLSENSEYDEAKTEQGKLYSRIAEITDLIENAEVVEKVEVAADVVTIGSHVRVLDVDEDAEEEYTIVGSQEANPMEGCISDDSPFGFALKGHKVGETVTVTAPVGELQFKIIAVENED